MNTLAKTLEAIRQRQQPVSSEEFWQQVEAFKDKPEESIPTSLDNSPDSSVGLPKGDALMVANG